MADTPFSVPSNVGTEELCDLINGLLNSGTCVYSRATHMIICDQTLH